ncbi:MAG TPA: DsrE family protein [Candidatus Krumholzibacteria bacterium]|nr:DsrE family protein [Candidatus Krumholzibacteria bacterium]
MAVENVVVVINSNGMGVAEKTLSRKLVRTYLGVLDAGDILPRAICLYAEGVKLVVKGSPVIEEFEALVAKGVDVLVCTTCLNHFGVMNELAVGSAVGMKEIVEAQWGAAKVITL